MIAAGHHTVINTIGLSVQALLSQEGGAALSAEAASPLAVEELLRFTSAARLTRRVVLERVSLYGRMIPPGTPIWLTKAATNSRIVD